MEKSTRSGPLVTPLCGVAAGAARRGPDPCYFKWEWWEFSMFFLMFFLHVFYHGTYHWRNMFNGKSWKISWKYHWRHMFHGNHGKYWAWMKFSRNLAISNTWQFENSSMRSREDSWYKTIDVVRTLQVWIQMMILMEIIINVEFYWSELYHYNTMIYNF